MKTAITLFLPNQFRPAAPGTEHWVQLSPFGDFGNRAGKQKIIQRFRKEDADEICNSFNSVGRKISQPLGTPFYIGHPDHPGFKGEPGHSDTKAYGRGKEMAVRHDANCPACQAFANAKHDKARAGEAEQSPPPCQEHGLFLRVAWNPDGEHLISNESFHGHSVNWRALPDGMEGGVQVFRPVSLKSVGFTNEPNIPVAPASLANAESSDDVDSPAKSIVPPKLKLIAGFGEDEDVTMEQVIAALEKARVTDPTNAGNEAIEGLVGAFGTLLLANLDAAAPADEDADKKTFIDTLHEMLGSDPKTGKDGLKLALEEKMKKANLVDKVKAAGAEAKKASDKHWKARQDLEQHLANERKERATLLVDGLVRAGKVVTHGRDAAITQLCNAGDKFDETATLLGNARQTVKTTPKSTGLANEHGKVVEGERERTAQFQRLMDKRLKEFPNESYDDRFAAVAGSNEGAQLFAQMRKTGDAE